jgi:hypothetical protein
MPTRTTGHASFLRRARRALEDVQLAKPFAPTQTLWSHLHAVESRLEHILRGIARPFRKRQRRKSTTKVTKKT